MYAAGMELGGTGHGRAYLVWRERLSEPGSSHAPPSSSNTRRLIEHLVAVAKERGCYKIILDCSEENAAFYSKAGFRRKEVQMVGPRLGTGMRGKAGSTSCPARCTHVMASSRPLAHAGALL